MTPPMDDDSAHHRADGRRARGDRTRHQVAMQAATVASSAGLSSISLDGLARDLGLSKSGVAAAFGSKLELQLGAVRKAAEVFTEHVIVPAIEEPPGRPRLAALVEAWLSYVEKRVFPGGCFMVAVLPEFDSQPGPVRDELSRIRTAWLQILAIEVSHMQESGELDRSLAAEAVAFEIDALLAAANLERNLTGGSASLRLARDVLGARVGL
jgi:AcrR family transcriptional regulator